MTTDLTDDPVAVRTHRVAPSTAAAATGVDSPPSGKDLSWIESEEDDDGIARIRLVQHITVQTNSTGNTIADDVIAALRSTTRCFGFLRTTNTDLMYKFKYFLQGDILQVDIDSLFKSQAVFANSDVDISFHRVVNPSFILY